MSEHDNEQYIDQRTIGDATVTLINDGAGLSTIVKSLTVPEERWRAFAPEANARGELILCYQVAHLRVPGAGRDGASILVDFGFDDPSPASQWREPRHHRSPGVEAGLRSIGVTPEQVTHVLVTHAHGDHFAGATVDGKPRFPNARVYLGRADWEGSPQRERPDSMHNQQLGAIEAAGLLELVDGEREIVPGVTMIHAPGESPGHSIVRLQSGRQSFYFLGDLFHHPCEVRNLDWVSSGRDAAAMRRSRDRLIAEAVPAGATLVYTHSIFPGWGRIAPDGDGYRWVGG